MNRELSIKGIVQGVGFRPFIYTLALEHELHGYVLNNCNGVYVEVEGRPLDIDNFTQKIKTKLPILARIDSLKIKNGTFKEYKDFKILQSNHSDTKRAIVSPDIAICDKCLNEMNSKENRRYKYPLINCTECGPRYTIINTLPYDRKNTSMYKFIMCKNCQAEYDNPLDRRYHAQPISCYDCGPSIRLYDNKETLLCEKNEAIEEISRFLKQGKIVAIKGIGGFHIVCDATNDEAVKDLRMRKKRSKKPFAVMFSDLNSVKEHTICNEKERELINSKERPIVIVEKNSSTSLSNEIAPDIKRLGVMIAYTPLHHLLFEHINFPIVATSANRSNEPIYRTFEQIRDNLGSVVDAILDFDREIINAVDDSVVQVVEGEMQTLRLGRGYAPLSIPLQNSNSQKILAVGAQQKSAIALSNSDAAILSPHIGDLESIESFEYFERTIETFKHFYDFESEKIICDKHPDYMSSKWAKSKNVIHSEVQHHYAHILACMMEHDLKEKVLAFSFDGTGYGEDKMNGEAKEGALGYKSLWGSEIMICDRNTTKRVGHMMPLPLLGSSLSIKEPRRMALSMLFECYGSDIEDKLNLELFSDFSSNEIKTLHKVWEKRLNSPLTSSMGRLFDIVASLTGLLQITDYEGQSGLLLESLCFDEKALPFNYAISNGLIDIKPMIKEIITLSLNATKQDIPDRFINTLVAIISDFSDLYPNLPVLFSGGVFQNRTLFQRVLKQLKKRSRVCYMQEKSPINDGGIALGQLCYALYN
ncbi:carbamoyltransferase HypF [Sulfurimonas aquatica]|uniref:carbamoyltransferase HypF n=1 Tax=Sulfurimonas aquatica TaxID=2672570 RepID=UPI001F61E182|nr:carbamoyltransferase HypF [Sulfurimonas aquatica]